MNVIRKDTLVGQEIRFGFSSAGSKFVITNFTDHNLIARFGENDQVGLFVPGMTAIDMKEVMFGGAGKNKQTI